MIEKIIKLLKTQSLVTLETEKDSLFIRYLEQCNNRMYFEFELNGKKDGSCTFKSVAIKKIKRYIKEGFTLFEY